MAVPEEIRKVPRPVNTIVEMRVNADGVPRYLVRERKGTVYSDGRSRPVNGGVIGYIVDGRYVPRPEAGPVLPDEKDMQTWALERLAVDSSADVIEDLRREYTEKDAEMLYSMAILRIRNPGLKNSRMRRDYEESLLSELYPSLPMSKNGVSEFLQKIGGATRRTQRFLRNRVERMKPGAHAAVDGVLVQDTSEVDNLGAISRKRRARGGKDILLVYAYDTDERLPVSFQVYEGSLPDSRTYADFIERSDLRDALLVGDKAFTDNAAKEQFSGNRNLGFLFPIRRNAAAIRRLRLYDYHGSLNAYPSVTYAVAHDVENGVWYYSYRDADRAAGEERSFLDSLRRSGKGLSPEKLAAAKARFGTVIYRSNRELDPEEAYRIYQDRWMLEQMFDLYKNIEEFDETRVHSDASVNATALVNFLSTLILSKMISRLMESGVLDDRTLDEVLGILAKTLRFRDDDGEWTYRALAEKDREVLIGLGLLQASPPKRGRGRPRKNP